MSSFANPLECMVPYGLASCCYSLASSVFENEVVNQFAGERRLMSALKMGRGFDWTHEAGWGSCGRCCLEDLWRGQRLSVIASEVDWVDR